MFTYTHFIWLAIAALIIALMLILSKNFSLSLKTVLTIMCVVSFLSEVTKILLNMEDGIKGGKVLEPGSLPFHLCSIQIFFIFGLRFFIKNENTKQILYNFMVPTSIVGAIISLFIPTIGTSFLKVQVYQYFIYHAFLIFFGIYLIREKHVKFNIKTLLTNYALLIMLMFLNLWVNSFLSFEGTNFMYLTRPPMKNLPILNLDHGWYVYFISLFTIAVVLMGAFQLPFILINRSNTKKAIQESNE